MLASKFSLRASLLFTLIFSIASVDRVCAQREFIVVEKTMSDKQITYSSGDEISYKLKDEDFFRTDHIVALNDTAIEFHYNMIAFHEIAEVNIKNKRFGKVNLRGIGGKVQFVGLAYIAIDQFNQVVVQGEDASFNTSVWIVGGLIFVGGTLMKVLTPKKIKLGGKYRIRYMNLTQY
jgi:hypothetical protein